MDLDSLIAPIDGETPVGSDPRLNGDYASPYFQMKDARSEARDTERQLGAVDPEAAQVESAGLWRKISDLAPKFLGGSAKDLEVASWYVEALARSDGFAGLAAGLALLDALIAGFWDDGLYPQADEDGDETRVAPLVALNGLDGPGTLIRPIKMIPFAVSSDLGPIAYWQYEQAVALSKVTDPEALEQREQAGAISLESIKRAVAQTPANALSGAYADIGKSIAKYHSLTRQLMEKTPDFAPPSSNIIGTLEDIQRAIRSMAPHVAEVEQAEMEDSEEAGHDGAAPAARAPQTANGAIANREDALRRLLDVAEFFERSEPTSMAPMALREVVRRARLPLHELLSELLHDDPAAREKILYRAGLRADAEPEA